MTSSIGTQATRFTRNTRAVTPITFSATALVPGDPAATSISGVVLDNTNIPIAGVTVSVHGTALAAQTDAQGRFVLQPAPVGALHLFADGSTAQRPGTWPLLAFHMVTIPGRDNTLGMPVFLLPIDTGNSLHVSETEGGVLSLPGVPGFQLEIAPGSATFPDGSKEGDISVTLVHADKVPMTPNFGQQPRLAGTLQPPGTILDPPAKLTFPNLDGSAPGEAVDLYSFDHDIGRFVSVGTGTVGEDGLRVRSDPGVGIPKSGWFGTGNPQPRANAQNVSVSIAAPNPIIVSVGDPEIIPAQGTPASGAYFWTVDNPSVTTLQSQALPAATMTGAQPGNTRVQVQYTSDQGPSDTAVRDVEVVEFFLEAIDNFSAITPGRYV